MSNNKQQTAVDWFHQKTWALKIQLEKGEISIGEYENTYATLYEQVKVIEMNQIINDYTQGQHDGNNIREKEAYEYYNKTYGGNR